jgi:transmembrane sensor
MDSRDLSKMIQRLKAGLASDEEKQKLEQFWEDALAGSSAADAMSEEERAALRGAIYAKVQSEINRANGVGRFANWSPWVWGAAAAFVVLGIVGGLLYWNFNRRAVVLTEYGKHEKVILPDSSEVTLNGNSTIRYERRWDDASVREVWIEGEGFFKVKHTADGRKFIVHVSDSFSVEVLGTEFNVKRRAQEIQVMLVEGRVKLDVRGEAEQNYFLAPGELVTARNKQPLVRHFVKHREYTSWRTDTLVFNRTSLREVAVMLKHVYGLQTTFKDSTLQERQLTGELSSFDADEILLALARTFDLDIARDGNEVVISNKVE